jgi:hypothetical protein
MSPTLKKDIIKTIVYSVFIMICIKIILNVYKTLEYYEELDNAIK